MGIVKWDPFRELHTLQDRMTKLFEDANRCAGDDGIFGDRSWSPAVDVYETGLKIVVKAELPGLDRKDIALGLEGNVLTLTGNRPFERTSRDENYHRIERAYGNFSRAFVIPAVVREEEVSADFRDGVLTISLPKSQEASSRKIRITS